MILLVALLGCKKSDAGLLPLDDVWVWNDVDRTLVVYENQGGTLPVEPTVVDVPDGVSGPDVHLGDLDGDGLSDLWVRDVESKVVRVWRNTGGALEVSPVLVQDSNIASTREVAVLEVSGDAFADLASIDTAAGEWIVWTSNGTAVDFSKSDTSVLPTPDQGTWRVGDYDGDGDDDVAHHGTDLTMFRTTARIIADASVLTMPSPGPEVQLLELDGWVGADLGVVQDGTIAVRLRERSGWEQEPSFVLPIAEGAVRIGTLRGSLR